MKTSRPTVFMKPLYALLLSGLLVSGCSKSESGGSAQEIAPSPADVAKAEKAAAEPGASKTDAIKVTVPQIAYSYKYNYALPADAIAKAQDSHIAMCDKLGPGRCHVLGMERAVGSDNGSSGSLKLVVLASLARPFGTALSAATVQAGGTQADSSIEAEDLSKQIVDTDAHLRSKQALADRLMALLKSRTGTVAELTAAEKSVSEVQEEIDATQSWLAEARGRVAMSTLDLSYWSDDAGGFWGPLGSSLGAMVSFFGKSLGFLIVVLATILPWAVVGGLAIAGWRYGRRRWVKKAEPGDVQG